MNRAQAEKTLAEFGFEIDWSVTGPAEGYWSGTIDAIGRTSICGDCFGLVVHAANAAEWYKLAIQEARGHVGTLSPCDKPDCELHGPNE